MIILLTLIILSLSSTKLIGNTEAHADNAANGILKNATIVAPLSNFWRSLEMPLIIWRVELKPRWSEHCFLYVAGTDNSNRNNDDNNIIFTIKDTKLYVPVVTLSARDNPKQSNLLIIGFERSVY